MFRSNGRVELLYVVLRCSFQFMLCSFPAISMSIITRLEHDSPHEDLMHASPRSATLTLHLSHFATTVWILGSFLDVSPTKLYPDHVLALGHQQLACFVRQSKVDLFSVREPPPTHAK